MALIDHTHTIWIHTHNRVNSTLNPIYSQQYNTFYIRYADVMEPRLHFYYFSSVLI